MEDEAQKLFSNAFPSDFWIWISCFTAVVLILLGITTFRYRRGAFPYIVLVLISILCGLFFLLPELKALT